MNKYRAVGVARRAETGERYVIYKKTGFFSRLWILLTRGKGADPLYDGDGNELIVKIEK